MVIMVNTDHYWLVVQPAGLTSRVDQGFISGELMEFVLVKLG